MAEIAEELCITKRYLRALEENDLDCLPGAFFYKSFVKQYAAILGVAFSQLQPGVDEITAAREAPALPGQSSAGGTSERSPGLEDRLRARLSDWLPSQPSSPAPIRMPDPIVQASNRYYFSGRRTSVSVAALAGVLILCSGFYAWWSDSVHPASAKAVIQATPSATGSGFTTTNVDASESTDNSGIQQVVLNLSATERTWLSVTSEGKEVFSGILQPSETKTLTGLEKAKMKVGNAGGLDIRWHGKEIGPIGESGQVRIVVLTPDKVQVLTPPPAPVPDASL
jgi:RodZ C-terminal domain/Helix-turn-helix domain